MIEDIKNIRKRENIHCLLSNEYLCNGQPSRDDYRIIVVAVTATEWQRSLAFLVLRHYVNYNQMLSENKPVQ